MFFLLYLWFRKSVSFCDNFKDHSAETLLSAAAAHPNYREKFKLVVYRVELSYWSRSVQILCSYWLTPYFAGTRAQHWKTHKAHVGGTLLACVVMAKTLAQSTVSCPPIRAQYLDWSGPMRGQHSGCPVVWRWERERGEQSLLWARGFILLLKHRPCILLTGFVPSLLGKLCSATKRAWFILPWTSSREMSPFYKLGVVNHPEAAEVILVSHKTLVEWQVGANGVLQGAERRGKRRKN